MPKVQDAEVEQTSALISQAKGQSRINTSRCVVYFQSRISIGWLERRIGMRLFYGRDLQSTSAAALLEKEGKNMDAFNNIVVAVNDFVWLILLFLLIGTGIFYSFRTRFVQVRRFHKAWNRVFGGFSLTGEKAGKDGMSSFQALATAIAAQVGTGNIAGCATALVSGGPGAIFWMWLASFFGMATIYGEAVLAQKTRVRDDNGQITGGPIYYMYEAFPGAFGEFLARFFSFAIIFALGFMGNMVQSNSISDAFYTAFGAPKYIVGILVAIVAAFIFLGGIERIAGFTEKVVPFMALLYLIGGVIIILVNIRNLPAAVASIFVCAFRPQAMGGAIAGITVRQAMRYGVARGLFSNEAGMGSTPHAHAMAKVDEPQHQGETAMIGVFIDTFVVLTVTALVILTSGLLDMDITQGISGTPVAQGAFATGFGKFGAIFVAICLLFFAFSTIIGWYFFAAANVKHLFGTKMLKPFSGIVILCILVGALLKVELVWNLSDLFNGLMVLPNLLALLALHGTVHRAAMGEKIIRNEERKTAEMCGERQKIDYLEETSRNVQKGMQIQGEF